VVRLANHFETIHNLTPYKVGSEVAIYFYISSSICETNREGFFSSAPFKYYGSFLLLLSYLISGTPSNYDNL